MTGQAHDPPHTDMTVPRISFAIALSGTITGCTLPLVTAYEIEPKELAPGSYEFLLYYNADATDEHVDRKAREILARLAADHGHEDCSLTRTPMVSPYQAKRVTVAVDCN